MLISWKKFFLVLLITIPLITVSQNGVFVSCEDEIDGDDDTVDIEQEATDEVLENAVTDDDDPVPTLGKSPDGETNILFIKPRPGLQGNSGPELHSGKIVEFLVGFVNKGPTTGFTLESLDASFRYPMDYSFHIQNFTSLSFNKVVKPKEQATLSYSFYVDESFAGRPFGLTINLAYRDTEGKPYLDAVYNETVTVVEFDEGLDGEIVFLYIFLAALLILLLVVGQHLLTSYSKKSAGRKAAVERGTSNSDDVDFEWIPKQTLREINKNTSPKQSPRQRKTVK